MIPFDREKSGNLCQAHPEKKSKTIITTKRYLKVQEKIGRM